MGPWEFRCLKPEWKNHSKESRVKALGAKGTIWCHQCENIVQYQHCINIFLSCLFILRISLKNYWRVIRNGTGIRVFKNTDMLKLGPEMPLAGNVPGCLVLII
jgi:hypothetical protein